MAIAVREWVRLEEPDFCRDKIQVFILVPVWDKCFDVLGTVLKNDGSQKEQRAIRTEPDLLNILRNFTQILADADRDRSCIDIVLCTAQAGPNAPQLPRTVSLHHI